MRFSVYLLYGSTLPPRLRELAILRVAHRRDCAYEWSHHVEIGKQEGLTEHEIAAVQTRRAAADEFDRAVLTAVDELDEKTNLSDRTWAALGERLDERQRMDFVFTDRRLHRAGHGLEHFWRRARSTTEKPEEVRRWHTSRSRPPAAGQRTGRNWAPRRSITPTRSIPAFFEARARGDLQEDVAQRRSGRAAAPQRQLLHQGAAVGGPRHVGDHRQDQGRVRSVPQHVPSPRKQAGVERLFRARRSQAPAASSPASTTPGATASTVI